MYKRLREMLRKLLEELLARYGSTSQAPSTSLPTSAPSTVSPSPVNPKLFTFFGKQEFLTFVSYFDYFGANWTGNMHKDLDWLVEVGIKGIRIMVNFCLHRSDVMYDSKGSLNRDRLAHFRNVVYQAGVKGLVTDISIISLPPGVSQDALLTGNVNLVKEVESWGYTHVVFDWANEHHHIDNGAAIAQAIRDAVGNKFYYGISVAGGRSPETACDIQIGKEDCNIVRYHDPREFSWVNDTVGLAQRLQRCAGNRPVYFDEPTRNGWGAQDYPASDFIRACTHAKNVGIAGWCFHTAAGFQMDKKGFKDSLSGVEKNAVIGIGKV